MPHEGGLHARCFRLHVLTNGVVPLKVAFFGAHVEVVRVNMFARLNGRAGKTNDLVVTAHRLTHLNGSRGNFVTRRHQAAHRHTFDIAAAHELRARNDHVIGGMETNEKAHE